MERLETKRLIHSISLLIRLIHQKSFQNMNTLKLYPGQDKFLALIKAHEGVTQKELASMHCVKPATITGMLLKLEANSYVYRIPDEADKRNIRVYLTPEGRNKAELSENFMIDLTNQMFENFTEEEIQTFLQCMDKINHNLQ